MRVLIVDDELTSRVILQKFLSHYGETHLCGNGKEAIDAFKNALDQGNAVDLICMDVMMPEMDGPTALIRVRAMEEEKGIARQQGVKVIMTTGLSDKEKEISDLACRCDAILIKPVRKDVLRQVLEKLGFIASDQSVQK